MGRPPDPEKRRELARRAVEVLEREGLGLSTARLAEALGVKRPTLLYHFADHGELVQAALEELLTEQSIHVLGRMAEHEHPVDRLYAQLRAVHEFHRGRERRMAAGAHALAGQLAERAVDDGEGLGLESGSHELGRGRQQVDAQPATKFFARCRRRKFRRFRL